MERDMPITDERLNQLANDPMMCNISPEVKEGLQELIQARARIKELRKELNEAIRDQYSAARDGYQEGRWDERESARDF
jgi:hypothetical protein